MMEVGVYFCFHKQHKHLREKAIASIQWTPNHILDKIKFKITFSTSHKVKKHHEVTNLTSSFIDS